MGAACFPGSPGATLLINLMKGHRMPGVYGLDSWPVVSPEALIPEAAGPAASLIICIHVCPPRFPQPKIHWPVKFPPTLKTQEAKPSPLSRPLSLHLRLTSGTSTPHTLVPKGSADHPAVWLLVKGSAVSPKLHMLSANPRTSEHVCIWRHGL